MPVSSIERNAKTHFRPVIGCSPQVSFLLPEATLDAHSKMFLSLSSVRGGFLARKPSTQSNILQHLTYDWQLCEWRRTIIHLHGHNPVGDTWKQWFVFQLTRKRLRLRHTSAVPEKTANVGVGICRIQLHKQSHNLDATELLGGRCLRLLVYD